MAAVSCYGGALQLMPSRAPIQLTVTSQGPSRKADQYIHWVVEALCMDSS